MATDSMKLAGRRVQIAGSANKATSAEVIRYGHRLVAQVVRGVLVEGGGLVLAVGREPRADDGDESLPSLVFDWTALEAAASMLRDGSARWPRTAGLPVVVVTSEKAQAEITEGRRALWSELLGARRRYGPTILLFAGSRSPRVGYWAKGAVQAAGKTRFAG
jgi:hypothetical protein